MIVDVNYYNDMGFQGTENIEMFGNAVKRAEGIVNLVTGGKCQEYDSLPPKAQAQLKNAICAQIEHYLNNGINQVEGEINHKVKIGDFSYESRNDSAVNLLSPAAAAILKLSGLLYAGTEVR